MSNSYSIKNLASLSHLIQNLPLVFFMALLMFITACSRIPIASEAENTAAKEFRSHPDKGIIYVCRPWRAGGAVRDTKFRLDGEEFMISNGSFYYFTVQPGKHDVWGFGNDERITEVELNVGKGEIYYLELRPFEFSFSSPSLVKVDDAIGKNQIKDSKMIQRGDKGPKMFH